MRLIRKIFIPLLFLSLWVNAQENNLYIPANYLDAYQNFTRSNNGYPGKNYWQNSAKYDIKVELFPKSGILKGMSYIEYFNESPDTLTSIVVRFHQDLYKKGMVRDFNLNPKDLHDGTKLTKVEINGVDLIENKKVTTIGTNKMITLNEKLLPKTSITIHVDWEFALPKISKVRYGVYPDSSFFVAYWYPQVSVYDDIDGWDVYSYTGMAEFYGDFSDFDVEITAPKNYIVWATGELQNPKQTFNDEVYNRFLQAQNSEEVVNIISKNDIYNKPLSVDKEKVKWKFKAKGVTDFAFASSKYYLWDGHVYKSTVLPHKKVFISAAYNEKSKDFYEVASVAKTSIKFFSEELPGVPFPYPSLTVFNGSGGMEFPMIVNDGSAASRSGMVNVTSHEIAHTYFPFMTGINEKKYAWMDEGWAVLLPAEIQHRLENSFFPMNIAVERYEKFAGNDVELPLMTPSVTLGGNTYTSTYRTLAYYRSAIAYSILRNYLGEDMFKKCLKEYINRWKGKHPIPYDFFFTFNDVSGEDLGWIWKPWFFEFGYPDLKIGSVNFKGKSFTIGIEKVGELPVPVVVKIIDVDGNEIKKELNVGCWKEGENKQTIIFENVETQIKKVVLGNSHIPDADRSNNVWKF